MLSATRSSSRPFPIPELPQPLLPDSFIDRALFQANFPHTPFLFRHTLDKHPAFQLDALFAIAARIGTDPASIGTGGNQVFQHLERDPNYRVILARLVSELLTLTGTGSQTALREPAMTLLIKSPGQPRPTLPEDHVHFSAQIHGSGAASLSNTADPTRTHQPWHCALGPGKGLFQPAGFLPLVQNGSELSVAIALTFPVTN